MSTEPGTAQDSDEAQERFSLLKLALNPEDRIALRYLLGLGSNNMRSPAYAKLRSFCEDSGHTPRETLELIESGALAIKHTKSLLDRYVEIKAEIAAIIGHFEDLTGLVNYLFTDGNDALSELRLLALECLASESPPESPPELLSAMMDVITQPEVPPTINEVRLMSLHKSKGLSVPYVFIAGCVQGLLPKLADEKMPEKQKLADLEEQRRLFYVGITRVKALLAKKQPGSLYLTYSKQMGFGLARQAGIDAAYTGSGVANLHASQFLNELGKSAPHPKIVK